MQHSFDIDVATKYGMLEAVLLNNIHFWVEHNRANETNFFDGDYWTFNSVKAYTELFPYSTEKKIRNALNHLIEEGLIKTGNYNKASYDRTLWYALTEKGKCIFPIGQMEMPQWANGNAPMGKPIPYINTNINKDINNIYIGKQVKKRKTKQFIPPSLDEVQEYVASRGNKIDAKAFFDYYTEMNWEDANGKQVKSWKGKVITWESNEKQPKQPKKNNDFLSTQDWERLQQEHPEDFVLPF